MRPSERIELRYLQLRSEVLQRTRSFFIWRGFVEVETPVRIPAPAPETHIDLISADKGWLRASPELQMKLLLCAGAEKIFQIGPCFRAAECGRRHNPEFTIVEWYRTCSDYMGMLSDTEALVCAVLRGRDSGGGFSYQGREIDLTPPWPRIAVRAAFQQWAGWDPLESWDAERFDVEMVRLVEPNLPRDTPVILTDYPAPVASLARLSGADPRVAERWELYIGGLEIANAYSELCDGSVQRERFMAANRERRALGRESCPLDEVFLSQLEAGNLPPCGGIALGFDRLVMLACDTAEIAEVRPFCQRPGEIW